MTHTPTPWAVIKSSSYNTDIREVEGRRVASTFVGNTPKRNRGESLANWQGRYNAQALINEANARHIVHCVNTHDDLVKAWEEYFAACEELYRLECAGDSTKRFDAALYRKEDAENLARAALAKAKGGAA